MEQDITPRVQLHGDNDYEHLCTLKLDRLFEAKFPKCFATKKQELMVDCGLTENEAREEMKNMAVELELYYHISRGFFAVESEAVDATTIYSPYTGEECLDPEDEEEEDTPAPSGEPPFDILHTLLKNEGGYISAPTPLPVTMKGDANKKVKIRAVVMKLGYWCGDRPVVQIRAIDTNFHEWDILDYCNDNDIRGIIGWARLKE